MGIPQSFCVEQTGGAQLGLSFFPSTLAMCKCALIKYQLEKNILARIVHTVASRFLFEQFYQLVGVQIYQANSVPTQNLHTFVCLITSSV